MLKLKEVIYRLIFAEINTIVNNNLVLGVYSQIKYWQMTKVLFCVRRG